MFKLGDEASSFEKYVTESGTVVKVNELTSIPEGCDLSKLNDTRIKPIEKISKRTYYVKAIKDVEGSFIGSVDVYSVLDAFEVNNAAIQHAIKKLLASGKRGYKDKTQDINEAIESLNRAIKMETRCIKT